MDIFEIKQQLKDYKSGSLGRVVPSSVLMPLIYRDNEAHLLFETRSLELRWQPGETCFPGGKIEKGETPEEAALRETNEELNLKKEYITILKKLDTLHTYSNLEIHCFLGVLQNIALDDICINKKEVDSIFTVPLKFFLETEPELIKINIAPKVPPDFPYDKVAQTYDYMWLEGHVPVPIYQYKEHTIWGMTGRMVMNLAYILRGSKTKDTLV